MKRAQASLFDGIFFLLIATAATGMIFYFLSDYGSSADALLIDSYTVNTVQSGLKALYFIDVDSLPKAPGVPTDFRDDVMSCLKRSIESGGVIGSQNAPGCGAYAEDFMKQALAKTMTIFITSGYDYLFYVKKPDTVTNVRTNSGKGISSINVDDLTDCQGISLNGISAKTIAVSAPFRIQNAANNYKPEDYAVFLCIWRSNSRT